MIYFHLSTQTRNQGPDYGLINPRPSDFSLSALLGGLPSSRSGITVWVEVYVDAENVVRQCILQASKEDELDFSLADPCSAESMALYLHSLLKLHFSMVRLPVRLEVFLYALMAA